MATHAAEETVGATFQETISSLKSQLPTPALSKVSVSFCFICLLHLCNEEELELTKVPLADEEEGEQVCFSDALVK